MSKIEVNTRVKTLLVLVAILFSFSAEESYGQSSGSNTGVFEHNLNLPDNPVSRRFSRAFNFTGPEPVVLADIEGPGCIRRFWITGSNIGRDVILRIYFDDEPVPYVEAPLTDFFGAMHNMMRERYPHDHTRTELPDSFYTINTPFLAIKPKNSFTSYFAMPFSTGARVEVTGSDRSTRLFYLLDWHEYPGQEMKEPLRFAARWRRESPVRDYQDEFILLDADGPGRFIGFFHSVDMLQDRHQMRWSHAGADNIYIDGDGDHPAHLRGIGGEDTFGTSYSGGDYIPHQSMFSDMPFYIQKDPDGNYQKLVGYRFFVHDAIHFQKSIHMRFASRAHDIAGTAYWYTEKPVRPYFEIPPLEKRLPGTELLRGEYDLPLPETGNWLISGPFQGERFEYELPTQADLDPNELFYGQSWQEFSAIRGFVDFNHIYRPEATNINSPILDAVAVARATIVAPYDTQATITLAWDDQLVFRINDDEPVDMGNQQYVRGRTLDVSLKKGENRIALWLNNEMGLTRGTWVFSFRAVTSEGDLLFPRAY